MGRPQSVFPDAEGNLLCNKCSTYRPTTEYGLERNTARGFHYTCNSCRALHTKSKRFADPEKQRDIVRRSALYRLYGVTQEQYDKMRADQEYACAVCGVDEDDLSKRLVVDHCHETGEVRGLLCSPCNVALGMLRDDPQVLQSAINYLVSQKESR